MKSFFTYSLIVLWVIPVGPLYAGITDTIHIPEVRIVKNRIDYYREDIRTTEMDTLIIRQNPFLNLGEILNLSNSVNLQSYGGPGALASLSLRGTGSSHTNILWNGLPLNALTSGMADLSLIPVIPFSRITLAYGTSGSLYGTGAFGGSVTLDHEPDWSNRLGVEAITELASFGSSGIHLKLEAGNQVVQYKLSPFFQSARNDFAFEDSEKPGHPIEKRDHNFFQNYGAVQNLNIRLARRHMLETGLWYQVKYHQIPLPMGSYGQSQQSQTDSTLKFYVKWNSRFSRTSLETRMGYSYDFLRYVDRQPGPDDQYAIDSRITNKQAYFDVNARFYQLGSFTLDVGGNAAWLAGLTPNYSNGSGHEYRANLITGAKYTTGTITVNGSLRYHFDNHVKNKLLFSLGGRLNVIRDRWFLRAHISNRYRLPSFNDRYWIPGGNVHLKPETGWGADLATCIEILDGNRPDLKLQYQLSFHSTHVRNWIQWIPGNGYWSPVNYKEVWARGLETELVYSMVLNRLSMKTMIGYAFTRSTVEDAQDPDLLNKDLQYVPHHLIKSHISIIFGRLESSLGYQFTGQQFTTEDNDARYALDPNQAVNLHIGYTLVRQSQDMTFRFRVSNLLNARYQMVRSYPMPGRSFHFILHYRFRK